MAEAKRQIYEKEYQARQRNLQLIVGTPKSVLPKIRKILEVLRPGIFGFWHHEASPIMTHEETMKCLKLLGEEVLPAVREMGKELGLIGPFERQPGSRPLSPSGVREPVAGEMAMAAAS